MKKENAISTWLFTCAALVFAMVVIGGITRLTNSGLSITEWKPIMGALPPLNDADWDKAFALYKASPEFQKKHFWMELSDFKGIFFWEWFHRLIGRLIGVAYGLPLLWFWAKGMIPRGYKIKLLIPFILGGVQGFMGWYMVQSGLVNIPAVSHFRLAAHLCLAFIIIALLVGLGLSIRGLKRHADKAMFAHGLVAFFVLSLTVLWGAFTAGLDAGLIYNESFPKMGEHWIPPAVFTYEPFWIGFFENHEGVQFAHRWLAMTAAGLSLLLWGHGVLRERAFPALHMLGAMVVVQFGLGLATLFSQVHIALATIHQAGGVILFVLCLVCLLQLRPQEKKSRASRSPVKKLQARR